MAFVTSKSKTGRKLNSPRGRKSIGERYPFASDKQNSKQYAYFSPPIPTGHQTIGRVRS